MSALFNIPYGLYVLTAKDEKDNGCIINTLQQVTSSPTQISITINKDNLTTKMIQKTSVFNVSILDKTATFDLIKTFGFSSGKSTNKFENFKDCKVAKNGVLYITQSTNSFLSAKVVSQIDVGTHITFIAEITEDKIINETESLTYDYYLKNIKPKPVEKISNSYICKICGYIYEGEELPQDFICPICKHGSEVFEKK